MKTKRVLLLMVLTATVFFRSYAQTYIGRQLVDQYPTTAWSTMTYGLTWLPTDYSTNTTQTYPLIIFLHGSGEGGDGVNGLWNLISQGLPQRIASGWDPEAVNPVDGQNYKFIVVSPQAPGAAHWSYGFGQLPYILYDVVHRYRVDTSRIYVTGLSAGGAGAWACVTNTPEFAKQFAAILPVSAAGTNTPGEQANLPLVGGTYDVKVWNVCGANDAWLSFAQTATNTINNAIPAPSVPAIVSAIPGYGHEPNAWNTPYDPSWRNNSQGMNCFEWLLKYKRSSPTSALTANAGTPQSVTLPSNAVTVSGSGTPAPGNSISAYNWTKMSGPATYTISSPAAASTPITGLGQGSYTFRLTVTDNLNATATSDVAITVNPAPNAAPTANAGTDHSITLPLNTAALNGSGADADGTVASYAWTKISGPASYSIVNAALPVTSAATLTQGTYQFELKVTDNLGAIGKDTVSITVNAAPNVLPVAAAGVDQSITLPINTVTLSGGGTDADGTITSYQWTKIAGPATYTIATPAFAVTAVNGLVQGTYQFELKVTDNSGGQAKDTVLVTVNPAPNVAPVANAGTDLNITLPANSVSLNGSGTDVDGSIASYQWTKISGPASYSIANASLAQTTAGSLTQGVYQFELKVTDNAGAIAKDTVSVTVNAAANVTPVANAGADQNITLPLNTVTLNGSGSDWDGTITNYQWTKISGPATYSIATPALAQTAVNGLVQGAYSFELAVTDNSGATTKDTVVVTVNAALPLPNVLPVANAGTDQSITLPINTVTLNGGGTDADGTITSYQWTKISGPATFTIASANSAQTAVNGLVQGVYGFELAVTDNSGAIAKDTILITVNAAIAAPNVLPTASAGTDADITLPVDSAMLTGSGIDADGTITNYQWTKISGPSSFVITSSTQAQTWVNGLTAGTYRFELTVTDDAGATAKDTVSVTVHAAIPVNIPPVAHAGADQTIRLPADSVLLTGSATDADGSIVSYAWNRISGPTQDSIAYASQAQTQVYHLQAGVYNYELTATDNDGAVSKDTVQITVNTAPVIPNILPVVFAGSDTTITLPADSLRLHGSASDADGTISSYAWTKISGPAQFLITDSTQAQTDLHQLVAGTYKFELAATDNSGATVRDTMSITVNGALNLAPVAHAGSGQTITLPLDSVLLQGSGTDVDGVIASYHWTKINGPAQDSIHHADSAVTIVSRLSAGLYQYELTVTDDSGAVAKDTVMVTVNAPPVVDCHGIKRYMVPGGDGGKFITGDPAVTGWYVPVNPGDTIVLRSQYAWSYFAMSEYNGTSACPIVITNEGGQVWLTAGIEAKNCQHLKITGGGDANTYYGFRIHNPGNDGNGVALSVQGKSGHIEIERADVSHKTYGVWAKQDPMCDQSYNYPNYVMDSIEIHHSRFKNIGQDCIYAGNTDPIGQRDIWCNGTLQHYIPMRISNINIHHLIIDSCMRTGIQISGADRGYNQVHDNIVTRCGYEYNQQQGTGISIGGMTVNCHVYNNYVRNTFLYGILSFGAGVNYIEHNDVDSSGWLDGIPNLISIPCNILASTKPTVPLDSSTLIIRYNKLGMGATASTGNIVVTDWGPPTWTSNNVICNNTKLDGATPADFYVAPTVHYINDCSVSLPNMPPSANAGLDITLTPPTDSTRLQGSGSDPDGHIIAYHWSKVNGPAQYHIAQPDSATTDITSLVQGIYTFRLTVTDNDTISATDDIQVSIAPPNVAPIANAGADQIVTMPATSTTLYGSGFDPDGTIAGYLWTKISGPASYTIANPVSAQTALTGLVQGVYQFELRVVDDHGVPARDTVNIMVNNPPPPSNIVPVANAGVDLAITLPTDFVALNGTGTDADGTITTYQWTKISGPSSYVLGSATSAQASASSLSQGVYSFELTVTDNSGAVAKDTMTVTVNPAPNVPPVANAGTDQTITLPTNTVTLNGSGSDADGAIAAYHWTKISGPAGDNTSLPYQAQTNITSLVQGVYLYELAVTDNSGATARDTVSVTVNAAPNVLPVANAGIDQSITLPINTVILNGTGTDADGTITNYQWTKISGPASYSIATSAQAQTAVNSLVQGVYVFELMVTDNNGAVARDTVVVTVNAAPPPPPNIVPVANAGVDQTITLPANTVTLNGSGTDADGTITAYQWTKISGPATFTIAAANSAQTAVSGLAEGVYGFELTVTDNSGAIAKDTVTVTVNAPVPNIPPVANAGLDQVLTLPTNTVALNGSGTDADGYVVFYQWSKISGPSGSVISSLNTPQTTIRNLVQGTYQFVLAVTDNAGAISRDTVNVIVNAAPVIPNIVPVANAGADQTITLPNNSAALNGLGTDADGIVVAYQWTKVSGPATFTSAGMTSAQTIVSGLVLGTYRFELKVTDNMGATSRDTVTINVVEDTRTYSTAAVYPNPAANLIHVRIDALTHRNLTDLKIFDARGVLVYSDEFLRTQQVMVKDVDIAALLPGTYMIVINADINRTTTLKFVKQ